MRRFVHKLLSGALCSAQCTAAGWLQPARLGALRKTHTAVPGIALLSACRRLQVSVSLPARSLLPCYPVLLPVLLQACTAFFALHC